MSGPNERGRVEEVRRRGSGAALSYRCSTKCKRGPHAFSTSLPLEAGGPHEWARAAHRLPRIQFGLTFWFGPACPQPADMKGCFYPLTSSLPRFRGS